MVISTRSPNVILQNLRFCFVCPLQRLPQITPGETLQRRSAQRTVHVGKGRTRKANPLRRPLPGSAPLGGRSKNQLGWWFQKCWVHLFISTIDIGQLVSFSGVETTNSQALSLSVSRFYQNMYDFDWFWEFQERTWPQRTWQNFLDPEVASNNLFQPYPGTNGSGARRNWLWEWAPHYIGQLPWRFAGGCAFGEALEKDGARAHGVMGCHG